ncbi:uncharacterized protein LOC129230331 [Uloborus diversus]|uniref:uncharacterized protein LOC129230331 n=1 Tax=Uloborus diversus TaxID=327109 RepID=UPI002409D9BB|nr:uncharacterized protein LOC129230331 [Uloborus diversus]
MSVSHVEDIPVEMPKKERLPLFPVVIMLEKIFSLFIVLAFTNESLAKSLLRTKREAYDLPDSTGILLEPLRTTFTCTKDGYYADTDNNCQVFHVCLARAPGSTSFRHWSFLCGNQTIFNQLTMTCTNLDDAIPCFASEDFHYLNDRIINGNTKSNFLTDEDIQEAENIKRNFRNVAYARQGQGSLTKP